MAKIRLTIRKAGENYAVAGLAVAEKSMAEDYSVFAATPMLRPGHVIEVDEDHKLASRDYAHLLEESEDEPNRPLTFANLDDAKVYRKSKDLIDKKTLKKLCDNAKAANTFWGVASGAPSTPAPPPSGGRNARGKSS